MKAVRLTAEEERELHERWKRGDKRAGDRLVQHNMALVTWLSFPFRRFAFIEQDDLLAQGNMALARALKSWDSNRIRFGSYASFWIRAYMMKWVTDNFGPVRFTTTRAARRIAFKYADCVRRLTAIGVDPDDAAVAKELKVRAVDVERTKSRVYQRDLSIESEVGYRIADEANDVSEIVEQSSDRADAKRQADELLANLDDRERDIIYRRYMAEEPETLDKIGKGYGISRERIRQLEMNAMAKMRRSVMKAV